MKKHVINLVIAAAVFLVWGCSTSNDAKPANTASKFTVNGVIYTEVTAADSAASLAGGEKTLNALGVTGKSADGTASAGLIFFFKGTAKPKAGSYTVISDATTMTAGQVGVLVIDKVNVAKQGLYGTSGLDGTSIAVAVSSSGKITLTLPTIAITGTNFDNTDPKNTVTTSVTGSISGTVVEQ